jgi:hypothetical protein
MREVFQITDRMCRFLLSLFAERNRNRLTALLHDGARA